MMCDLLSIAAVAVSGKPAIGTQKALQTLGFDFKIREERGASFGEEGEVCPCESPDDTTVADFMLSSAEKSGDAVLVRYIVKTLSIGSEGERLRAVRKCTANFLRTRSRLLFRMLMRQRVVCFGITVCLATEFARQVLVRGVEFHGIVRKCIRGRIALKAGTRGGARGSCILVVPYWLLVLVSRKL